LCETCSLFIIIASYTIIFVTVIRIPSKGVLQKALSTCASHLTDICFCHEVILLFNCVLTSKSSLLLTKVDTVFYSMVVPTLSPLIYSLRNKDKGEHQKVNPHEVAFSLILDIYTHTQTHTHTYIHKHILHSQFVIMCFTHCFNDFYVCYQKNYS
jgi:hypothetical protein